MIKFNLRYPPSASETYLKNAYVEDVQKRFLEKFQPLNGDVYVAIKFFNLEDKRTDIQHLQKVILECMDGYLVRSREQVSAIYTVFIPVQTKQEVRAELTVSPHMPMLHHEKTERQHKVRVRRVPEDEYNGNY